METAAITAWTFQSEIPIPADVTQLLTQGEQAVAAYSTFRDSDLHNQAAHRPRRSHRKEGRGLLPALLGHQHVVIRKRRHARLERRLELWTRAGHVKIKLGKNVDVRRLDLLIAHAVLGGFDG